MKKLTKSIALVAIAAIAGVNVYIMNDINFNSNNDLSLLTLENIAEANESRPAESTITMGNCRIGEEYVKVYCRNCYKEMYWCAEYGTQKCIPTNCSCPNRYKTPVLN